MTQVVAESAAIWEARVYRMCEQMSPNLNTMGVDANALVMTPVLTFASSYLWFCLFRVLVEHRPVGLCVVSCWLKSLTWSVCAVHREGVGSCPVVRVIFHQAPHIETKSFCQVNCRHIHRPFWIANIANSANFCWFTVFQFLCWSQKCFQSNIIFKISLCLSLHSVQSHILRRIDSSQVFWRPDQLVKWIRGETLTLPPKKRILRNFDMWWQMDGNRVVFGEFGFGIWNWSTTCKTHISMNLSCYLFSPTILSPE